MCSPTPKVPYTWVTDGFGQSSDLTLCVQTEEVVEVSCSVRANDGSYAFAKIASEACGKDYHVGIDFCAVFETKTGLCVGSGENA